MSDEFPKPSGDCITDRKRQNKREREAGSSFAAPAGYDALEQAVAEMADGTKWNWTNMLSQRDAAEKALLLLSRVGLIEHCEHPYGGLIWRVNGNLYGRTDGITSKKFDELRHNEKGQR